MNMNEQEKPIDKLLYDLRERAKELNCLYEVQELLSNSEIGIDEICEGIIKVIPPGWQYPDVCQAKITYAGKIYTSPELKETHWLQSTDIVVRDEIVGRIEVYYTEERPLSDEGPFLKEERKLINTIAEQFGFYILHQQLRQVFHERRRTDEERRSEGVVILEMLKRTDPGLLMRISRKMINFLGWHGIKEAEKLLEEFSPAYPEISPLLDVNRPFQQMDSSNILSFGDQVFEIANRHMSQDVILENIQNWIKEDRSGFLIDALVNPSSSLSGITSAIERFHLLSAHGIDLTPPREQWFRVALIRRILSSEPHFVKVAKQYLDIGGFIDFMSRVIHLADSHGKLGGKSSGLYLAAEILKKSTRDQNLLENVKTPKTWYLTSDNIFYFMTYNNLEDIVEQKYKELGQVRQEYPYILHIFKNSPLPPEIIKDLSVTLDDFGDVPLIVRSSSLLEDQTGAAFAGKYKSLFIANQGSKEERLVALIDAIAEVFASLFAPDPIEYRYEHGLIDYHEEMGILIQEVVGVKIGHYYLPAFAGVAFSNNEFRWSSRIKHEDGLVRLVPGLGTRAVDRLSDDYPILIAPGQPRLRVNVTVDEIVRYSPRKIDVINLEKNEFETIEISRLLKEYGRDYPMINELVSILMGDHIQQPGKLGLDFEHDEFVVTFDGLVSRTPFIKQIQAILHSLQEALDFPVDIEFAHDGTDFYLLQCREQSSRGVNIPATIPGDLLHEKIVFTAKRYVPNGSVVNIKYIVYIDAQKYSQFEDYQDLLSIGRAVGRLNEILPRRQFVLMGPGRWGSRGDIRLGVSVTYSDINNTAMLIEIAYKRKDYVPEPSFGTHFFQDLVEASIRYLPLYPQNSDVVFNEDFFMQSENILADILPDYAHLSEVVRVIDVSASAQGQVLQVQMNADQGEAVGYLSQPVGVLEVDTGRSPAPGITPGDGHWRWRYQAAENIAAQIDVNRFGVKNFFIFGSAKNATAGPESDIDLLIHFHGTEAQRKDLLTWLEGWSISLSEINYQRTGYRIKGLLDVHIVTDEDVEKRTSFAAKIGATNDPAQPLTLGTALKGD
jgi:pyruvate, water dikinase